LITLKLFLNRIRFDELYLINNFLFHFFFKSDIISPKIIKINIEVLKKNNTD